LIPDLLFLTGKKVMLVADTKYKRLDAKQTKLGVSEADIYQMLAYTTRFRCQQAVLVYPQADTEINYSFVTLSDVPHYFYIHTINLRFPPDHFVDGVLEELRKVFSSVFMESHNA
jgi:5-methylcytosine-specific restriction enzyme subunit McrC